MIKEYLIRNKKIKLELVDNVFKPSLSSISLASNIKINKNDKVFDVGCGTGILGITAVNLGAGFVKASDINKNAILLSKKNAKINKIKNIEFILCSFFGNNKGKYDVIIANLPQVPIPKNADKSTWIIDGYGGLDGTKQIIKFLKLAKNYLGDSGRVYMPVSYLSNSKKILSIIKKFYKYKIIASQEIPLESFLMPRIEHFSKLKQIGICKIHKKKNNWYFKEKIYELRLK